MDSTELAELKAEIKMLETKIDAIIKILGKEGVLTPEEVQDEVDTMLQSS